MSGSGLAVAPGSSSRTGSLHPRPKLEDEAELEQEPLLSSRTHRHYGRPMPELDDTEETTLPDLKDATSTEVRSAPVVHDDDNESDNHIDDEWLNDSGHQAGGKRQLGLTSASFLIFNRVIGTGIFATPSVILRSSGSVGLSLVLWLLGATVAACGTAVYIELGTGLPRSGGEKNYLDFIYKRPRFLATCMYAAYAMLIGWESASCSVFGEYATHALSPTGTLSNFTRFASLLCITFAFLLHSTHVNWGVRLQNTLGFFKLVVLMGIAVCGLAVLIGLKKIDNPPQNFRWDTMWKGSLSGGTNAFVTGMYNVIWSFIGYSNANYALSEVRDPVRTLKRAAPLAMLLVTIIYMLVNVGYYAVVSKDEMLGSGRIVAALFFGKVWGVGAERVLSGIVALSTLGNVLAVLFTHGRVIQELGRERILPFSSFFASNRPFGAPLAGLLSQYIVTAVLVVAVPAGDAYLFMLNSSSYPYALINTLVSGGLLLLHVPSYVLPSRLAQQFRHNYHWDPPFRAHTPIIAFFFLSNVFLTFAPLIPPARGFEVYERLPYWLHVFTGILISGVGAVYWYIRCRWLPARHGYRMAPRQVVQEDGIIRSIMTKVYL